MYPFDGECQRLAILATLPEKTFNSAMSIKEQQKKTYSFYYYIEELILTASYKK